MRKLTDLGPNDLRWECSPAEESAQLSGRSQPTSGNAAAHVRIDMVDSFEYTLAEIGRGWSKTSRPIQLELADSYAQFAEIHLCQSGVVR